MEQSLSEHNVHLLLNSELILLRLLPLPPPPQHPFSVSQPITCPLYSAAGDYLVKPDSLVGWVGCSNSPVFMSEPGTLSLGWSGSAYRSPSASPQWASRGSFWEEIQHEKALVRSVTIIKTSLFPMPLPFKHNSPVSSSFRKDSSFLSLQ